VQLNIPSGYLVDNHAVWGNLGAGAILSRLYAIEFPDMSASEDWAFDRQESDIRLMLGCMQPDERLQIQYYTGNEFSVPIDRFEKEGNGRVGISSSVRGELCNRFRDRVAAETLIQANVRLCLSTRIPKLIKDDGRHVRGFSDVFKVLANSFKQREQFFNVLMAGHGGSVKGLDNRAQYRELLRFWSPSQARQSYMYEGEIDWLRPIEDLCRASGISPQTAPDHGFYMDGYYFGVLVAKTFPRQTWARTMDAFLALTMPNLRVVLNMEPTGIDAELLYEQERFSKLWSNAYPKDGEPDPVSIVGLENHQEKIRQLMSNRVLPFKAQLIVIVSDRTPDSLDGRLAAVRAALGKTGCVSYEPSVATATIAFFNCATPGIGPWVRYRDYWHKVSDAVNVANMWPAGSTPRAELDRADWITDGDRKNLIGGRMFTGAQPVHMFVAAIQGAGKSVLLQTIAIQTAPMFGFIVVIDDGLSWATTCHKLDPNCRPIIVRADGSLTFNIFDTRGLPLSSQHLASATALCHLLIGRHSDSDQDKLRAALLAETISAVYGVRYRKWRNANPTRFYDLCVTAAALINFQEARKLDSFIDAFLEVRANLASFTGFESVIAGKESIAFGRNPETEYLVQALAISEWTPDMFPTLSDLQDELHAASIQKGPHQSIYATLASLVHPWLRDGLHGGLVDGVSNIDLGSAQVRASDPLKVVHFELEKIDKSQEDLRAVVGFLITNEVRNHIQGMPRSVKKQVIIEEMTSFLKVPNGAEIVVDYYARMRKYSCQVISVFQDYGTLFEVSPKAAKAIVSMASAMLLLRNHNRQDIDTLSEYMPRPIPDVIKDQITRFPKPAEMPSDDAYAGFVYAQLDGDIPKYTVGRNYISDEVEQITSSSGDVHEEKMKIIRMENAA